MHNTRYILSAIVSIYILSPYCSVYGPVKCDTSSASRFFFNGNYTHFSLSLVRLMIDKAGSKSVRGSKRRSSIRDRKRSSFDNAQVDANTFTFNELATATNNFRDDCLLGEGGFGGVYKGWLERIQQVGILLLVSCLFMSIILSTLKPMLVSYLQITKYKLATIKNTKVNICHMVVIIEQVILSFDYYQFFFKNTSLISLLFSSQNFNILVTLILR